jgi:hypothetical protein
MMEATFGTFMTSFFKLAKIQTEFLPDAVERLPRHGTSGASFPHISSEDITKSPFLQHAPYRSVSQPPGRGPIPAPAINYIGPREVLLQFVILLFLAIFMHKCFIMEIF